MKNKILVLICGLCLITQTTWAQNCDQQLQNLKAQVYAKYSLEQKRSAMIRLRKVIAPQELQTLNELSTKFKTIPPNSDANMNDLFALQKQSRHIVRNITSRAGYDLLNPEDASPFDALITEIDSSDGYTDYVVEVRSLLIFADPLPHFTIWAYREDPAHNPWKMVSLGIMPQVAQDYASWRNANSQRVSGTMIQFLKSNLPTNCQ